MPRAVSSFRLEKFEPEPPYARDDEITYGRVRISKTFTGDLEAQSEVAMLALNAEPEGAGYVALERIEGSLKGRKGTFALLHIGTMTRGTPWAKWPIVPGSGTEALKGISGEARIEVDAQVGHTLLLDYQLP